MMTHALPSIMLSPAALRLAVKDVEAVIQHMALHPIDANIATRCHESTIRHKRMAAGTFFNGPPLSPSRPCDLLPFLRPSIPPSIALIPLPPSSRPPHLWAEGGEGRRQHTSEQQMQ